MKIVLRAFDLKGDSSIVFDAWLKVFYFLKIPKVKNQWYTATLKRINELVLMPDTINIACIEDSPDTILGFSVNDGQTLEFVYVKELHRKQGIMKLLLKNKNIQFVKTVTRTGALILEKHPEIKEI